METTLQTNSAEATEQLAQKIGSRLKGGEVIELVSDLGGGKTTFVRGLARGAGSEDPVASPTFTVSKLYQAPKFEIYHFDFYRLRDAGLMEHELQDLLFDGEVVLVLEWSGVVANVLPVEHVVIELTRTGEDSRSLHIKYPDSLTYLLEGLC